MTMSSESGNETFTKITFAAVLSRKATFSCIPLGQNNLCLRPKQKLFHPTRIPIGNECNINSENPTR